MSRPIKALQNESVPALPVKHTTSLIKSSPCSAAVSRRFAACGRQDRRTVRGVGAALEAAGDRRAAVARLERAAAVAPAQIRPAILTELAAIKAAGAP